jgi:hypothetical protein
MSPPEQSKEPLNLGRIAYLPTEGKAIICSDLHGNIHDFNALLSRTQLPERLEKGEAVYLIITGDIPDTTRHRFFDSTVPEDGDCQILNILMELDRQFPDRIFYLEGNHDFHIIRLSKEIENFHAEVSPLVKLRPDGPHAPINQDILIDYLNDFRGQFGEPLFRNNIGPYDMLSRVTEEQIRFLGAGPIIAVLPNAKALVTHAGPVKSAAYHSLANIVETIKTLNRDVTMQGSHEDYYRSPFHQLLNHRFPDDDYTLEDVNTFLRAFNSNLMITGHTPLTYIGTEEISNFPNCKILNNLGWIGLHQAILCTSFGALRQESKVYLEIDLSIPLESVEALRPGYEILPLYPTHAPGVITGSTAP